MTKTEAIKSIGAGSVSELARWMGLSRQSIYYWPEDLPKRVVREIYGQAYLERRDDILQLAEQDRAE